MTSDLWALDFTSQRVALDVLRRGPISRADLGRGLGLSSGSLTRITKPLVRDGLLVEGAPLPPAQTGRPSRPLDVAASTAHFVGVKLMRGRLFAVLTDLKGSVADTETRDGTWDTPADAVATIAEVVDGWRSARGGPDGVGVSLGAAVDAAGLVWRSTFLPWPPVRLGAMLEEATGVPSVVDNDVNAFTVAEHWFGFGRACTDFAVITLGAGVGLGLVCRDDLVRGHRGAAGMVGHLRLSDGRRAAGVLEWVAIARRVAEIVGRPVQPEEVPGLARTDPAVDDVTRDVARCVGELVAMIARVTAPERVLVSGEAVSLILRHQDHLTTELARGLGSSEGAPEVRLEELGFQEWARGSAVLAIRARMTTLQER